VADSKPNTKGLYIKTYGCQMNVYDSERMKDVLKPLGYAPVDSPEAADLVVLNTCHIREKATEKVFSELGRLREMKQEAAALSASRSPAALPRPKATRSCAVSPPWIWWSARNPITACRR